MPDCGCNKAAGCGCNNTFEILDNSENCECKNLAEQIQCEAREIMDLAERLKCTCDRPIAVTLDYEVQRPNQCCSQKQNCNCNCNRCCR